MSKTERELSAEDLRPEELTGGDIILRRIVKSNASPVLVGMIYAVGFQLVGALMAWRAGHLRTVGGITGYFDSPATIQAIIIGPVVGGFYAWIPRGIVNLFKGLHDNGVIGDPTGAVSGRGKAEGYSYETFLWDLREFYARWWWTLTILAIVVVGVVTLLLPTYLELQNYSARQATIPNLIVTLVWTGFSAYAVLPLAAYSLFAILWLNRLFKDFHVNIRPLHPDRAGGLSPLGNFSLTISYVSAAIGIILVVTPIQRSITEAGVIDFRWSRELLVSLTAYIIGAPFVFFAPLSVAHGAMQNAKDALLLEIDQRFETEYTKILQALDSGESTLGDRLKTLEELQNLHTTTSRFPVWPFNIANLRRFGTTFLSPIALAILIDLVSELVDLQALFTFN